MPTKFRHSSALFVLVTLLALTACNRPPAQSAQTTNATQPQPTPDQASNAANPTAAPTLDNSNSATTLATQPKPPAGITANAAPPQLANSAPQQPLIVPAGTSVVVRLQQSLSSATAVSGERFEAVLDQPLVSDNQVIVPAGTMVAGHVTFEKRDTDLGRGAIDDERVRHGGHLSAKDDARLQPGCR